MQLLHYDCCVSFGKQNMYPVTTAGSFYCLYEPTLYLTSLFDKEKVL